MKKVETRKLFFGKYLYKITLMNVLGTIFRGKNFTYAGEVLDVLQQDYENGRPLVRKVWSKEFKKRRGEVDSIEVYLYFIYSINNLIIKSKLIIKSYLLG